MSLNYYRKHKATMMKLRNLVNDSTKSIQGASYKNSVSPTDYITRPQVTVTDVVVGEESSVNMIIPVRLEVTTLPFLGVTRSYLEEYATGDIPELADNEMYHYLFNTDGIFTQGEGEGDDPDVYMKEPISANRYLITLDIHVRLTNPDITYSQFKLGGEDVTTVTLSKTYSEQFEQSITLLFGKEGRLTPLSNYVGKNISTREAEKVLELISGDNLTGRVITSIEYNDGFIDTSLYPLESLIEVIDTFDSFNFITSVGKIGISRRELTKAEMVISPNLDGYIIEIIRGENRSILISTD